MNEKYDKLDAMLFIAVKKCGMEEVEKFNNPKSTDVTFSKRFYARKRKILRRYKSKTVARVFKKVARSAAIALLIILSMAFITVMSVSALRTAVLDAVVDFFDDYVKVGFGDAGATPVPTDEVPARPTSIEEVKHITDLPDGVVEEVALNNKQMHKIKYFKNGVNIFSLVQETFGENEVLFDNVDVDALTVYVNNTEARKFKTEKGADSLCWSDGNYIYTIICNSKEYDIIKLAESVQ
ncbi:MAG: DUF4367 domain-containing protein [Ruminococcaceae bacterium]|nr:DUF4367 domain-containing protein [Oscillospiraceae bacterium]